MKITVDSGQKVKEVIWSIGIKEQCIERNEINRMGVDGDGEHLILSRLNEYEGCGLYILSPLDNNANILGAIKLTNQK